MCYKLEHRSLEPLPKWMEDLFFSMQVADDPPIWAVPMSAEDIASVRKAGGLK